MNVTATQLSSPNVNAPTTEIARANDHIESVVAQVTPTIPSAKVDLSYPADYAPVTSLKGAVMYNVEVRSMDQVRAETTKLAVTMRGGSVSCEIGRQRGPSI